MLFLYLYDVFSNRGLTEDVQRTRRWKSILKTWKTWDSISYRWKTTRGWRFYITWWRIHSQGASLLCICY